MLDVWNRSLGWYLIALLDTLDYFLFPKSYPGYAKLLNWLITASVGVLAAQDTTGSWRLVMNESYPGKLVNY